MLSVYSYDNNSNPHLAGGRIESSNRSLSSPCIIYEGTICLAHSYAWPHHLLPDQFGSISAPPTPYVANLRMTVTRSSSPIASHDQSIVAMFLHLVSNICHPDVYPDVVIPNPVLPGDLNLNYPVSHLSFSIESAQPSS